MQLADSVALLRIYLGYAVVQFKIQLVYRIANWAGLATNCFFLFFRAQVLEACYDQRELLADFSRGDAVSYASVSQALIMVIPQWGRVGLAEKYRDGQLAVEICRPVNLAGLYLSRQLGASAYYLLTRSLPVLFVGAIFGLLSPPAVSMPYILLSIFLGSIIAHCVLILIECSCFWLESERGVHQVVLGLSVLFSGMMVPPAFFPDELALISHLLPFRAGLYTPVEVYLGKLTGPTLWQGLGVQAFWALGLGLSCHVAIQRGLRKLVVHGG